MSRKSKAAAKAQAKSKAGSAMDFEAVSGATYVVIGDGWAATAAVGFLATSPAARVGSLEVALGVSPEGSSEGAAKGPGPIRIRWITATGARLIAPLPVLENGLGAQSWQLLASRLGIETGPPETGSYLREFRNKAFRSPAWLKSPTPETRLETRDELIWAPEARIAPVFESRFRMSLGELEEEVRRRVLALPGIERIEEVPVQEIKLDSGDGVRVVLGSGQEIRCDRLIYADRWSALPGIAGLPKPLTFNRSRAPVGVLQASFTHTAALSEKIRAGLSECFYAVTHKDSGEEFQRSVWGYFIPPASPAISSRASDDASSGSAAPTAGTSVESSARSVWTFFLTAEEVEDNHEIAKKLRRMKQTLDRIFGGAGFLPEGTPDFLSTISSEQVRFEEFFMCSAGQAPEEPVSLPKMDHVSFLTDGYGPSSALEQTFRLLTQEASLSLEALPTDSGSGDLSFPEIAPESEVESPEASDDSKEQALGDIDVQPLTQAAPVDEAAHLGDGDLERSDEASLGS